MKINAQRRKVSDFPSERKLKQEFQKSQKRNLEKGTREKKCGRELVRDKNRERESEELLKTCFLRPAHLPHSVWAEDGKQGSRNGRARKSAARKTRRRRLKMPLMYLDTLERSLFRNGLNDRRKLQTFRIPLKRLKSRKKKRGQKTARNLELALR